MQGLSSLTSCGRCLKDGCFQRPRHIVTLLCASLTPDGTLTIANTAHLFPCRNGEEVSIETGMPLGIVEEITYEETTLRLEPGDSITFLSGGVVEARAAE